MYITLLNRAIDTQRIWQADDYIFVYFLPPQDEYDIELMENTPTGATVAIVTATDLDLGEYGIVRYNLEDPQNRFTIDPITVSMRKTFLSFLSYIFQIERSVTVRVWFKLHFKISVGPTYLELLWICLSIFSGCHSCSWWSEVGPGVHRPHHNNNHRLRQP